MRMKGELNSSHAITDLYDVQRRTFLVQYPIWLVIVLAITGVIAFSLSGFLGYHKTGVDGVFYKPWELYLWFSALLVVLQVSIFRNKALRGRLITTLIISLICIVIVYLVGGFPGGFVRRLLERFLPFLASAQLSYTIVNFGLIAVYWVDTVRRWVRRMRNLSPNPIIDLTTGQVIDGPVDPANLPSMQELVSGDLIAGALLAGLLALFFQPSVIGLFIHTIPPLNSCNLAVSFPPVSCVGADTHYAATLTFVDQAQALIYLPVGLVILALAATLGGFGAIGGVGEQRANELAALSLTGSASASNTAATPIASGVTETVLDTLRSALDRRIRLLLASLARSLRNIAWPALLFIAVYGIFQLSINIQNYLHNPKTLQALLSYAVPAVAWGLLSVLGVVISAALTIFRWRVVDNTLRFLGLIGFIVLLTFWIFSLALWGFNKFLELTIQTTRRPFDPPSWSTAISFAALAIFGVILLIQRMRSPQINTRSASAARQAIPVGVSQRAASDADTNATNQTPSPDR